MSRDPMDRQRTDMQRRAPYNTTDEDRRRRLPNDIENLPAPASRPAPPSRQAADPMMGSYLVGKGLAPLTPPAQINDRPLPDVIGGARRAIARVAEEGRKIRDKGLYAARYTVPGQDMAGPGMEIGPGENVRAQNLAKAGGSGTRVVYVGKNAQGNSKYSDAPFEGAEAQIRGALGWRADRASDPDGANGYGRVLSARETLENARGQQEVFDSKAPQVQAQQEAVLADLMARRFGAQTAKTESEAARNTAQAGQYEAEAAREAAAAAQAQNEALLSNDALPANRINARDKRDDQAWQYGMDLVEDRMKALGDSADAQARAAGLKSGRDLAILQAFNQAVTSGQPGDQRLASSQLFQEAARVRSELLRNIVNAGTTVDWGETIGLDPIVTPIRNMFTGENYTAPWNARDQLSGDNLAEGEQFTMENVNPVLGFGGTRPVIRVRSDDGTFGNERALRLQQDDPRHRILQESLEIARRFRPPSGQE